MPDKTEMSIPQLTEAYNRLAEECEANYTGLKPLKIPRMKLFKDRKTAIQRLTDLETHGGPAPKAAKPAKAPAKKAVTKKPVAKKSVAIKAVPKAAKADKAKPEAKQSEEFGFKAGGERDKLLVILSRRMGRQVPRAEFGELGQLLSKVTLRIKRKKLPYKLIKEKTDAGEFTYGLYNK